MCRCRGAVSLSPSLEVIQTLQHVFWVATACKSYYESLFTIFVLIAPKAAGPPYAPVNASLGGLPSTLPDVPASAVFLFLYMVFAITHQQILVRNKKRRHMFAFSGALFGKHRMDKAILVSTTNWTSGFCAVRMATTSLRIAWSNYPHNIILGIVAQVFVYAGTILMYVINWYFAQRVVRAQHPRLGWSTPYRIVHRAAIGGVLLCLCMLVLGAIQPFLTLNPTVLHVDRYLSLAGQTYFAAFCFAPFPLILLSLALPRRGTDKFGAGRFRNNVAILMVATLILSTGSIFRAVIAWLPPTPIFDAEGRPVPAPWYFSKACFYGFNLTTELIVVILYAVSRIDLRFHVPDGCSGPGDYRRKSAFAIQDRNENEKLKRQSSRNRRGSIRSMASMETVEEYEGSLFDDSRTLANSLRFPSTVLEVDRKSGNWKMKKVSRATSTQSFPRSDMSLGSFFDPSHTPPPLPTSDWPLRDSQATFAPRESQATFVHKGKLSRRSLSPACSSRTKSSTVLGTAPERDEALDEAYRQLVGTVDIAQPPPVYTREDTSRRGSYDPSLNLNFSFCGSSSSIPHTKRSSEHHNHRNVSSMGSDSSKAINSRKSDGSAYVNHFGSATWAESSTPAQRHHQRASASSDLTRHHQHAYSSGALTHSRESSEFVIVNRTRYEIVSRPTSSRRTRPARASQTSLPHPSPSSWPEGDVPELPAERAELSSHNLARTTPRPRSLSESDRGSDGRSSNRAV